MTNRFSWLLLVAAIGVLPTIPVTGDDTPVSYRLATRDGRVVIQASTDKVIPWAAYSCGPDISVDNWLRKHDAPVDAGIHLFQLPLWDTKGQYWDNPLTSLTGEPVESPPDSITWREMAPKLIERDPEARFIMRFTVVPDPKWRAEHLDQYPTVTARGGGMLKDGKSILPSLASDAYLQLAERNIRDVVAWCERQIWRDRIVGYTIFIFGEGATEVALFDQMFDDSEPMQSAFAAFAKTKYANNQALAEAWQEDTATLDNVAIPTKAQWLEKKSQLGLKHWPDPAKVRRERDYFELQKQLFHRFWKRVFDVLAEVTADRPVIKGCDNFKQHMLGWLHNSSFHADHPPGAMDHYNNIMLATGAMGAAPLLDHPGLDMLQTPGMYYNRAMGYAWEAEGLSDSMTLRGKVNFMEADMRTWINNNAHGEPYPKDKIIKDAGVFMTPAEMRAGFDRTLAWALSRNQMYYYASVWGGNWWFHEPPVTDALAAQTRLIGSVGTRPWHNTTDAICLVVDDESPIDEDFSTGFQHLAIERQIEEGLALCGVPYRIHLLSDLERDDFPDYKCYLFPNLFRITERTEALLKQKVLRNGHVAIFGPGLGISDGKALTAAPASRLLGVEMELVDKTCSRRVMLQDHGHPISRRLETQTFGDSFGYGPLLVPTRQRLTDVQGVKALGAGFYYYFDDRPGLFIHDFEKDDYAVIFSPAVPLPPQLLREIARYAGCHIWSEQNAVIYASANFVALHTARSGRHVIQLPRKCTIIDLSDGKSFDQPQDRIELDLSAPATRLFQITPLGRTGS